MANSRRGHGLSAAEQAAVETSVADGGVMEGYVRRKPHNPHKVPPDPHNHLSRHILIVESFFLTSRATRTSMIG